jgi:hypothetical protein
MMNPQSLITSIFAFGSSSMTFTRGLDGTGLLGPVSLLVLVVALGLATGGRTG